MTVLLFIGGVCIFAVIVLFAFPQFSPIPYFPSNTKDLSLILKALQLKNDQVIIDLGAGDGVIIFSAAAEAFKKGLSTRFIATDINPVLLCIIHIRRLFHPNRNNITITHSDMFTCSYSDLLTLKPTDFPTFYIYISPWFIEKTIQNIKKQIPRFRLVSYFYQVQCLPNHKETYTEGVHRIYEYNYK